MKKKLYLSGPMAVCKDQYTWMRNFQKYEDIFTEQGFEVVNPAKNEVKDNYAECIRHSLQQELECDAVFFLPNSIHSYGAKIEYEVAKACGLEIILDTDEISYNDNYGIKTGIKNQ